MPQMSEHQDIIAIASQVNQRTYNSLEQYVFIEELCGIKMVCRLSTRQYPISLATGFPIGPKLCAK